MKKYYKNYLIYKYKNLRQETIIFCQLVDRTMKKLGIFKQVIIYQEILLKKWELINNQNYLKKIEKEGKKFTQGLNKPLYLPWD